MSKFLLNMDAVNEEAEKMNSSRSGKNYFSRKDIKSGEEVDIRILPPILSLNGLFYLKRVQIWINKKPYISPKTFGEPCPIHDLLNSINKGDDDDLKVLANSDSFSIAEDYLMPILLLKVNYKNSKVESVEVVDDCVKIFDATWSIVKKLNNLVSHRQFQNGSSLGIFDPKKGHNIIISKEEKSKRVEYDCMAYTQPSEIDPKYLEEIPDIVDDLRKRLLPNNELLNIANNYFYGKSIPDSAIRTEESDSIKKSVSSTGGKSLMDRIRENSKK